VPVLARTFEQEGFCTIFVTMMPYWAKKIGVPRTLAVAYPFGHTLGLPGDTHKQRSVLDEALSVFEKSEKPGMVFESEANWPEPAEIAIQRWQPEQPSPVIQYLAPHLRQLLRQRKKADQA
jgi:hypothetical protein